MAAIHPRFAHPGRQALYRDFPRLRRQKDPWNRPKSTISLCAALSGILTFKFTLPVQNGGFFCRSWPPKIQWPRVSVPNPKFWEVRLFFSGFCGSGGVTGKKKGILRVFGGRGQCDAFATHLRHICDTSATHLRHICDTFATHLRHICDTFGRPNGPKQRFWAGFHAKRLVLVKNAVLSPISLKICRFWRKRALWRPTLPKTPVFGPKMALGHFSPSFGQKVPLDRGPRTKLAPKSSEISQGIRKLWTKTLNHDFQGSPKKQGFLSSRNP